MKTEICPEGYRLDGNARSSLPCNNPVYYIVVGVGLVRVSRNIIALQSLRGHHLIYSGAYPRSRLSVDKAKFVFYYRSERGDIFCL